MSCANGLRGIWVAGAVSGCQGDGAWEDAGISRRVAVQCHCERS